MQLVWHVSTFPCQHIASWNLLGCQSRSSEFSKHKPSSGRTLLRWFLRWKNGRCGLQAYWQQRSNRWHALWWRCIFPRTRCLAAMCERSTLWHCLWHWRSSIGTCFMNIICFLSYLRKHARCWCINPSLVVVVVVVVAVGKGTYQLERAHTNNTSIDFFDLHCICCFEVCSGDHPTREPRHHLLHPFWGWSCCVYRCLFQWCWGSRAHWRNGSLIRCPWLNFVLAKKAGSRNSSSVDFFGV